MKKLLLITLTFVFTINAWTQFVGPINAAMANTKQAWIYPTFDKDANSINSLKDYVTKMYNRFKSDGSILLADSIAIKTDLSDFGLMIYGTISSNLFLAKYKSTLPVRLDNDKLIFETNTYMDKNIKLITCFPNPQNINKGMVIYTALDNSKIIGINNIFHGPEDYVISTSGNFDKSGTNWQTKSK